jgi:ABC-type multidrug transport system ATPase subunit
MDAWNAGLDCGVTSHEVKQCGSVVVVVGRPGAGCTVVILAAAGAMGPAVV